ncbi:WEE protein kinase Mik1 [Schizosaccharomyces cryophilus OY26]|uniref:WEE protein kinase Mik1 n=1 Tax=Schizosaccharomyces cryophilus (strain OY26 / ATCC MYA-4695 / CBS 11777 / NBRC 106824 / NRRL Y48691) TaxID=653667 RepID=S9X718_SCHCR|nr:WEE protein kinase Mik1 [Schizosaccharomyces cryophilus OY26]EPY49571.1 WEE protein kinase Mik1 [Schizosaccharomyces cryophilus OY26]
MDSVSMTPSTPTRSSFSSLDENRRKRPLFTENESIFSDSVSNESYSPQSHVYNASTFEESPHTPLMNPKKNVRLSTTLRHGLFSRMDITNEKKPPGLLSSLLDCKIKDRDQQSENITPLDKQQKSFSGPFSTGLLSKREKQMLWEVNSTNPKSEQPHTPCKRTSHMSSGYPESPTSPSSLLLRRKCPGPDFLQCLKPENSSSEDLEDSVDMLSLPTFSCGSDDFLNTYNTPNKSQAIFLHTPPTTGWKEDEDEDDSSSLSWTPTSPNFFSTTSHEEFNDANRCTEMLYGRFSQVKLLSESDFSYVYKVSKMADLQKDFSIVKIVKRKGNSSKETMRQIQEANILRQVRDCPRIVNMDDFWEYNDQLFLQLEYCENGDLGTFLTELGLMQVLDAFRVWKILLQLSQGLYYLHKLGVVHLDVKPSNVLITREGNLKISDFGLSSSLPVSSLTDLEGDRMYIAPEVLMMHAYDKPADIFSLGLSMIEAATNVVLPDNGVEWQRLRSADFSDLPKLTQFLTPEEQTLPSKMACAESLEKMLNRMIAPNPEDRITAEQLLSTDEIGYVHAESKLPAIIFENQSSWLGTPH